VEGLPGRRDQRSPEMARPSKPSSPATRPQRRPWQAAGPGAPLPHGLRTVVTTSQVYDWCFARRSQMRRSHLNRRRVWQLLQEIAVQVGRAPPYQAWLWRLKSPAAEGSPPSPIEIMAEFARYSVLPIFQAMSDVAATREAQR
jgi:hypothetical protein